MDTPDNIQEDAVAVAMARGIRDISKALTSHAYGETKEIILVKLDDAKRHIDKASNLVAQKEATETHEPPIVKPEDLTAASRLAEAGEKAADANTTPSSTAREMLKVIEDDEVALFDLLRMLRNGEEFAFNDACILDHHGRIVFMLSSNADRTTLTNGDATKTVVINTKEIIEIVERLRDAARHEFPDDAPGQHDNPQNGIEVEEEEPDNEEEEREGDDEPDEEEDESPDDTGELDAEMREEDYQGLTLVAASKLIYQAAKVINHDLDNKIPVDPDEFPSVNYGLAAWLRTQEQTAEGATERKAARHLRHIARFIAKCMRRGKFHHVRRVRKYRD